MTSHLTKALHVGSSYALS